MNHDRLSALYYLRVAATRAPNYRWRAEVATRMRRLPEANSKLIRDSSSFATYLSKLGRAWGSVAGVMPEYNLCD